MRAIHCQVFEGLCNRMNAIASAMVTRRPVRLRWAINKHCPIPYEQVFNQCFGMNVVNETIEEYEYARSSNNLCWFYPQNVDSLPIDTFGKRIKAAYRRLLEGLCISEWVKPSPPALGIAFRYHLADMDTFEHYWRCFETVALRLQPKQIHVAADSLDIKRHITDRLKKMEVSISTNQYPLMVHDCDRSHANVLGMCADLRSLACCALGVVANSTRSTAIDSLRGFGVQGYHTWDDKGHRYGGRDHLFSIPQRKIIDLPEVSAGASGLDRSRSHQSR